MITIKKTVKVLSLIIALSLFVINTAYAANEWNNDKSVIRPAIRFKDVDEGFWGYEAIENATACGWFSGYTDGTFKPNDTIKRSEAAKAIAEFLKLNTVKPVIGSFDDVDVNSWYSKYVEATGNLFYPTYGSSFCPGIGITREDALYVLVKAYNYDRLCESADTEVLGKFSDSNQISENMRDCVAVGLNYGIMGGFDDGTLKPKTILTRAQFATLLNRLYNMGKNTILAAGKIDRIELSCESMDIGLNKRFEITAEAVYAGGARYDYSKHLIIKAKDNDIVKIIENRVYGIKKGRTKIIFGNANMTNQSIDINVY